MKGYGIGVTVGIPGQQYHPEVRILPLAGFPTVPFGTLWQGFRTPVLDRFLPVAQQAAHRQLEPGAVPASTNPRKAALVQP